MRIVSQDGRDFLYDSVILRLDENFILAKPMCDYPEVVIAVYDTAEHAKAEFNRLHMDYSWANINVFTFKTAEELRNATVTE